jgi:hypothetical protein
MARPNAEVTQIEQVVKAHLAEVGFKKKSRTWRRHSDEVIAVVMLPCLQ